MSGSLSSSGAPTASAAVVSPARGPCLLAMDTSTEVVHLAVVSGEQVYVESLAGGAQASASVLPAIQALLGQAGVTLQQVDAIGFGRGPGAFTGLRTACAVAQGLAVGVGCLVLPLDTLAAVVESAAQRGETAAVVWGALDARMGEVYAAPWQRVAPGVWQALRPLALYTPATLAEAVAAQPAPLAGNALKVPAVAEALQAVLESHGVATWPDAAPDGLALAALARAAQAYQQGVDPALALPLYVRDKVAQTTAEREAAALARAAGAAA